MSKEDKFIDRILGGEGKLEKGVATLREGFKPKAPANLVLPKPTAAPAAPVANTPTDSEKK